MKQPTYITVNEMLDLVKDQDEVVVGMASNEPQAFMSNLHKIADRINHVSVTNCLPISNAEFFY